ncbi:MAG: YiiX/YebB-like N1pC/P60 family cysteine hydrolase [Bacteroidota bacterium]|nr:YiiX/YebB-like N1pC/P60 family cysteine hydrolase [Bacteroidota bacterium]
MIDFFKSGFYQVHKLFNFSFFVLIFTFCIILFSCSTPNKKIKHNHDLLNTFELKSLHNGDIILRKGYGLVSNLIVKELNEKYKISHCGIIEIKNGKINVIHSVSHSLSDFDGVQKNTIADFLKGSTWGSVIVVRARQTDTLTEKHIISKANYYLSKKVRFDSSFNFNDSSEFFCQEFIYKAYDLIPNSKSIKFSPFTDTNNFRIIINHQSGLKKQ